MWLYSKGKGKGFFWLNSKVKRKGVLKKKKTLGLNWGPLKAYYGYDLDREGPKDSEKPLTHF